MLNRNHPKIKIKRLSLILTLSLAMLISSVTLAFAHNHNASTLDYLKAEIINGMVRRDTAIVIHYTGGTTDPLSKMLSFLWLQAELSNIIKSAYTSDDYLKWSWISTRTDISGYANGVDITISVAYHTTKEQEDYVTAKVSSIIPTIIKETMTDHEKIIAISQYIVSHVTYDYTLVKTSAYTALVEGESNCLGYTLLLDKMVEAAGLQSTIINGTLDGRGHVWNLINIYTNWYHLDVTNTDITKSNVYFLVSDSILKADNYNWDETQFVAAPNSYPQP